MSDLGAVTDGDDGSKYVCVAVDSEGQATLWQVFEAGASYDLVERRADGSMQSFRIERDGNLRQPVDWFGLQHPDKDRWIVVRH